VPFVKQMFNLF